jgi:plasmid stabilization system protein ParE
MEVIWDNDALRVFDEFLNYVSEDSPANASIVAKAVIEVFNKIQQYPYIFPSDKYKSNNDNSYRAFELYRIRISYRVEADRILIVRCRHTKQRSVFY